MINLFLSVELIIKEENRLRRELSANMYLKESWRTLLVLLQHFLSIPTPHCALPPKLSGASLILLNSKAEKRLLWGFFETKCHRFHQLNILVSQGVVRTGLHGWGNL